MFQRIKNFISRCRWLGRFIRPPFLAPFYLGIRKIAPGMEFRGAYGAYPFTFRGSDLSAIREVLHKDEYAFLKPLVDTGKEISILDIGGHIGLFALWVFSVNQQARILSVEASPANYKILERNRSLLPPALRERWTILNRAAWKDDSFVALAETPDSLSHRVSSGGTRKVQGITLPEILNLSGTDKTYLMKLDIEGAEESFLCADPAPLEKVHNLVIELHPKICDAERVMNVLRLQFPDIREAGGRHSGKQLLSCRK